MFHPAYLLGMNGIINVPFLFQQLWQEGRRQNQRCDFHTTPVCKRKPEVRFSASGLPQNCSFRWTPLPRLLRLNNIQEGGRGVMVCMSLLREHTQEELRVLEGSADSVGRDWPGALDSYFPCVFSDGEKIEFEWNTGTNVDTKKATSNFPVDLSALPKSLHTYAIFSWIAEFLRQTWLFGTWVPN